MNLSPFLSKRQVLSLKNVCKIVPYLEQGGILSVHRAGYLSCRFSPYIAGEWKEWPIGKSTMFENSSLGIENGDNRLFNLNLIRMWPLADNSGVEQGRAVRDLYPKQLLFP
jgi:hypothetical protein